MPADQINLEYFFRALYELLNGGVQGSSAFAQLQAHAAHLWLWIIIVGYALSIAGLYAIVYIMVRLFELRKREETFYNTPIISSDMIIGINPRWEHIESLIRDENSSQWREAIVEADIMLDDALARRGYVGNGVGEKLKSVDPGDLRTLQDAWEVHKVRNQIAHEGSAFALSDTLARRTIARYEAILREMNAL